MKKLVKYVGLLIIFFVLVFISVSIYNTLFHFEYIYKTDFINQGEVILPDDIYEKISEEKMYIIVMKYHSLPVNYTGQINDGKEVYNFSGYASQRNGFKGSDNIIATVEINKTKSFNIEMTQKIPQPYSLIVMKTK